MTISEYKSKLISVVKNMELEHGCDISSIEILAYTIKDESGESVSKEYVVNIEA